MLPILSKLEVVQNILFESLIFFGLSSGLLNPALSSNLLSSFQDRAFVFASLLARGIIIGDAYCNAPFCCR